MDVDVKRYAQAMPQYQEPLNFLQCILDFQANLADRLEAELHIEPGEARERWRAGHPRQYFCKPWPISAPCCRRERRCR
jgi:hypothetical protein